MFRHSYILVFFLAHIVTFATLANAQPHRGNLDDAPDRFIGPVVASGVSGIETGIVFTVGWENEGHRGIHAITMGERGDNPCYAAIHIEMLYAETSGGVISILDRCGRRGPTGRSLETVGWKNDSGDLANLDTSEFYVHGIQVCERNEKIKGLRVFSKNLLDDGTLAPPPSGVSLGRPIPPGVSHCLSNCDGIPEPNPRFSDSDDFIRSHCNSSEWRTPQFCPADHLAVAMRFFVTNTREPKNFGGAELLCKELVSTENSD